MHSVQVRNVEVYKAQRQLRPIQLKSHVLKYKILQSKYKKFHLILVIFYIFELYDV